MKNLKNLKNLQVFTYTKLHELLIVNNLHEKSFTDNQDWQNFDSACYLWYAFVLQLNALVYMKNALIFSRSDARNSFMYIITSENLAQCNAVELLLLVLWFSWKIYTSQKLWWKRICQHLSQKENELITLSVPSPLQLSFQLSPSLIFVYRYSF